MMAMERRAKKPLVLALVCVFLLLPLASAVPMSSKHRHAWLFSFSDHASRVED